ncbi:MAG TPA: hypothetical protein VIO81_02965 [Methyloversatilis sp.]
MFSARKLLFASLCLSAPNAFALGAGDIAFTAFNADEDGWAIVALADLGAHSTLYFSDSSWNGSAFTSAEGFHTWDTGTTIITAGTVVRFSQIDQIGHSVSVGTLTSTGNRALSSTAETLYAYQGAGASLPTTFLAAVSSEAASAAATAIAAAGLQDGVNAVVLPAGTDYSEYAGLRSGKADFAFYRALINTASNWNGFIDGDHAAAQPNLTTFTIPPVPEVSGGWMMAAGLALVAARWKR